MIGSDFLVIIGADHAGFELKNLIINYFNENNIKYNDVSNHGIDLNDDYVDVAEAICKKVLEDPKNYGIAICGTGAGICIACNKMKGIRAAVSYNENVSTLIKEDNNCNVICFGGRQYTSIDDVISMIKKYENSNFQEGRHERRLNKIKLLEEKFGEKL